jgi:glycosyltransferase involved in cell wall biosynthesis
MRVTIFAFNHYDNVLSYANAVAKYSDIEIKVILIAHGDIFSTSSFQANISSYKYGLHTKSVKNSILPHELGKYFDPDLDIWLLKLAPRKVNIKNLLSSFLVLLKAARRVQYPGCVYHFNGVGLHSLILSYLIRSDKKVLTIHDYLSHSGEGGRFVELSNRLLARNFKHFIQHYKFLSKAFSTHYGVGRHQVHTIRSGTFDHFRLFKSIMPEYSDYILAFGRISTYKGLKYLVQGFNEYCLYNNDTELVIAGGGNASDIIETIAGNEKIHLINRRLSINELTGLIRNCRYAACTYTDVTHSAVVAVSYTFGKPVLVHDIGGLREVVRSGETGILVENLEKETIMKGIQDMNDLISLKPLQKNIDDLTQKGLLNWEKIAQDYESLYSMISKSGR